MPEEQKDSLVSVIEIVDRVIKTTHKTNWEKLEKEFEPTKHKVTDQNFRPDKTIKTSKGTKTIPVGRIVVNYQKLIVGRATSFLFTNPVIYKATSKDEDKGEMMLKMILHILKKNKSQSINRTIATKLFSETEVAEYWYPVPDEKFWNRFEIKPQSKTRLRCVLFSQAYGDTLYPMYNDYDDMVAFGRGYKIVVDEKEIEHLDVFTSESITTFHKPHNEDWSVKSNSPNLLKKIPIVYYSKEQADWEDVQTSIDRIETLVSNFGDTNDYFGSPLVKVTGKVTGFAEKGEQGKIIQLENGSTAEYLTWTQAPESIKSEAQMLDNIVFSGTQTPNISFESVKGLSNVSGIALKLLFLDSHMKAQNNLEVFDEAFSRRVSILKSYCALFNQSLANHVDDIDIDATITPFMPENIKEAIELLLAASQKPILSQKSAIEQSKLVPDADLEMEQIKSESIQSIGETFV